MALFENYEARIDQINAALTKNGIKDIEEAFHIVDEFVAVPPTVHDYIH